MQSIYCSQMASSQLIQIETFRSSLALVLFEC